MQQQDRLAGFTGTHIDIGLTQAVNFDILRFIGPIWQVFETGIRCADKLNPASVVMISTSTPATQGASSGAPEQPVNTKTMIRMSRLIFFHICGVLLLHDSAFMVSIRDSFPENQYAPDEKAQFYNRWIQS